MPDDAVSLKIEDYAIIGDAQTAGLVGRDGSVDWLCLPRFDSAACFAALLGDERHGRWLIAPAAKGCLGRRRYRDGTLVLETEFDTPDGTVRVVDCMPHRDQRVDVVRVVEGVTGRVTMRMELVMRFDYGSTVPWVRRLGDAVWAVAGPDALCLRAGVEVRGENFTTVADFVVEAGQRIPFVLTWGPSTGDLPEPLDAEQAITVTESWWRDWSSRLRYEGQWSDAVQRSLITLKALTYEPTGGIVAAPTTALPERLGGIRNWDYRYCWLRDATFTLHALALGGYHTEARAWRDWLLRSVAGDPGQLQILYGPAGERRLPELELPGLPGYEGSAPVRIGNAAATQFQLDVYGEVMDALQQARRIGVEESEAAWAFQRALMEFLETHWTKPDHGIWEVRGRRRHFTHSKVMAWVAADRAVSAVERFGLRGDADRWRRLRAEIHDEVCRRGYDPQRQTFVQAYDSTEPDANLLMIPLVGFLPHSDPRVKGTVETVERELCPDGLVRRYRSDQDPVDGLPAGEAAFLVCSFWLVDNLALLGRRQDALDLFERLLALRNDVGLLSEEYDPKAQRLLGNFPQAFSHVGLVNSATNLSQTPSTWRHGP